MGFKPIVYFTSNVFTPSEIGSNDKINQKIRNNIIKLWEILSTKAELKIFDGRFQTETEFKRDIEEFNPDIIGCHLSHKISASILEESRIFAICTSTAGYNHIQKTKSEDILITHTPGVLHETVADYTIALIMANLRNLIDLHNDVWNGNWAITNKWDIDQNLSSVISNKIVGIVGLGEIGKEVVKRLYPWGVKILYYDLIRMKEFEKLYPNIDFRNQLEKIFQESDIVSLHLPLNKFTEKIINRDLLKLMKKNALLVNTARGLVLDFDALLDLLEKRQIQINLAFDVFPVEPIDIETLKRLNKIKETQPEIRMLLLPHNASADADTRGKMITMFLKDIIKIIESKSFEDLSEIHLIPEQKSEISKKNWRIYNYWKN